MTTEMEAHGISAGGPWNELMAAHYLRKPEP